MCSICNQRFGRKANAERHNELKHDDLATISDTIITYATNIKSQSKNPYYKDQFKQFQSHSVKKENTIRDELFSTYFNFKPDDDILKVMKIFGQFEQPFEELEKLIDEDNELIRANNLSNIFLTCLNSHRPIKCMKDIVEMYKSIKCMNKLSYYFFKSKRFSSLEQAKIFLQDLVRNSDFFMKNIN